MVKDNILNNNLEVKIHNVSINNLNNTKIINSQNLLVIKILKQINQNLIIIFLKKKIKIILCLRIKINKININILNLQDIILPIYLMDWKIKFLQLRTQKFHTLKLFMIIIK